MRDDTREQPSRLHQPKFYQELSGISYDSITLAIRRRELKASDLRRTGGTRPRWYISESDWQAWLDSRANVQAATTPVPRPRARQYV